MLIHIRCRKCRGEAKLDDTGQIKGEWYRFFVCVRGHVSVVKDNGRKTGKDMEVLSPEEQLEAMREINRILEDREHQTEKEGSA